VRGWIGVGGFSLSRQSLLHMLCNVDLVLLGRASVGVEVGLWRESS